MRLIDVDKLLFSLEEWELNETPISTYPKPKEFTADDMQRMIWRTIRDCKSAVEEQPTVQAIPVEWIMWDWRRKQPDDTQEDVLMRSGVLKMLRDWEKENGRSE